jgi:hypothetical protein
MNCVILASVACFAWFPLSSGFHTKFSTKACKSPISWEGTKKNRVTPNYMILGGGAYCVSLLSADLVCGNTWRKCKFYLE